jgi:hypothetical protein
MIHLRLIQQVIHEQGFHKLAEHALRQAGEHVPASWTNLEDVVQSVTFKMAANQEQRRAIRVGLLSQLALEASK